MNDEIMKILKHYKNTIEPSLYPEAGDGQCPSTGSAGHFLGLLQVKLLSIRPTSWLGRSLTPVQAISTAE